MDDFMFNSDHQNQLLDTQRQNVIIKESEDVPGDLLQREKPLAESHETQPKNQSQSVKARSQNNRPFDHSKAIEFHQISFSKNNYYQQNRNYSRAPSKVVPVSHQLNASAMLNHFNLPSKFNKSKATGPSRYPMGPVLHATNFKPFQDLQMSGGHTEKHDSTKDTCLSFHEQIVNPTFLPIPVCGSKDYPMHTIHCYQSSMTIAPYQQSTSPNETSMHVGDSEVNVGMGVTCIFQNIAVNGQNVMESLRDCARNCDIRNSKSLLLLDGKLSQCPIPTISLLMNKTDQHDYTRNFVQELLMLNKKKHLDPSQCARWVNKTTLFFIANEPYNIYFQFLTYYNVFLMMNLLSPTKNALRVLASFRSDPQDMVLVRLSDATDYKFGNFERNLFPRLTMLSQLGNVANIPESVGNDGNNITCFQKVVKVPWAYSAFPFRSVVDSRLKNQALKCYNTVQNPTRIVVQPKEHEDALSRHPQSSIDQHERNVNYRELRFATGKLHTTSNSVVSSMVVFRSLVLNACGITERVPPDNRLQGSDVLKSSISGGKFMVRKSFPLQVIVIQRKPYLRHGLDHPNLFQRILTNEAELLTTLTRNISRNLLNVKSVYMEELDICDQVRVAHSADILIGVHGAGLVHSWWMRESGVLLELVPLTKLDRPTYKVLAGLIGRKYYSVILKNSPQKHHSSVNVSAVLELLAKIAKEWTAAA